MTPETRKRLSAFFSEFEVCRAEAVPAAEFRERIAKPGYPFDADYEEFVVRHGGATVGPYPVYGLRMAKSMGTEYGESTAPGITQVFRRQGWPGTTDWLVISIDHGGNPMGFGRDLAIYLSDETEGTGITRIAKGFEEFLLRVCDL